MKKIVYSLLLFIAMVPLLVNASVFEAGDKFDVSGDYDSTKFIAGNNVTTNANIDGIAFVAGNNVNSGGKVAYGFLAGNNIQIEGEIEKDLFAAGNTITISKTAKVPRDVYLAGSDITINTKIGRNLNIGADRVDLRGVTVLGNATIYADHILVDEKTVIEGTLEYYEESNVENLDKAQIGNTKTIHRVETKKTTVSKVIDKITNMVSSYIAILVILLLIPKFKKKIDKEKFDAGTMAKTSLLGLATLVVIPVICIIGMITLFLLPLSFILLALYIIAIYLSTLIAYYMYGKKIYSLTGKKSNLYIELLIGIVLFKLITMIPYIGGLVLFISLLYGMGLILNSVKDLPKEK